MLADDHHLFRQTISRNLIENCEAVEIIGEAPDGMKLLELMEVDIPDVVLLDLEMPVLDGHKTLAVIKERYPGVKTIILSTYYNEFYIAQMFLQGAAGYLSKSCYFEDLVLTIEKVYENGFYFNESISKEIIHTLYEENRLQFLISEKILTDREIQVVRLICNGKMYKETADELNISLDTVKFHVKSIYKKTQINSIVDLVKYAIKVGITSVT